MSDQLIDTPEALGAANEARLEARRGDLSRIARGKGARDRMAQAACGLMALAAFAALLAGDYRVAGTIAGSACLCACLAFSSRKRRMKTVEDDLREMDKPI